MRKEKTNNTIVFVGRYCESETLTGPEKAAKRIFNRHSKYNKTFFLQYFFDGKKYGISKKLFGKEIIALDDQSNIITVGLFRILPELSHIRPGIVHIITFERFEIILFIYKLFRKTKYIYNVHGVVTFGNYVLKKLPLFYKLKDNFCERVFLKFSDVLIFPSVQNIDLATNYFTIDKKKVIIIPNGCDEEFVKTAIKQSWEEKDYLNMAIQSDKIGFGLSLEFLNKALKILKTNFNLFIIGNSNRIDISNSENLHVYLKKKMSNKEYSEFLSRMNIFLSLYKFDSFSISALEAMASGAIPIVTIETGLSGYIKNEINGFIVPFGDYKKLAGIFELISNKRELSAGISTKARKIYDELSWDKVYSKYSELYHTIF